MMLILACMLIGACDKSSTPPDRLAGTTYNGVIPCADCEGILYELSLEEGQRFAERLTYIGESSRPFTDTGSYAIRDDTLLVLEGKGDKSAYFAIEDSVLVMLDQKKERITSSLAGYYILDRKESFSVRADRQWSDLRRQGVDFRATGNEPFWGTQIDFDKQINFHVLSGDSLQAPAPAMEQDTATSARLLKTETASGTLTIALYPTACMDGMSGKVFTHRVVVESGNETFRGCGHYINEQYKLHDFWTLYSLSGTPVNQQDTLKKQPALQFDLVNNHVSGNTGCNQLGGNAAVEGDSLSFGQLITTKMACAGVMELESQFLDALDRVNRYDFSNEDLLLLQDEDTLMVLQRTG